MRLPRIARRATKYTLAPSNFRFNRYQARQRVQPVVSSSAGFHALSEVRSPGAIRKATTENLEHLDNILFTLDPNKMPSHNPLIRGNNEYKYPGIDLPLRQSDEGSYEIGSHLVPDEPDNPSQMLQIREVAMMILVDRLTDKPKWHEKVFNQDIVDAWRREALAQSEEQVYKSIVENWGGLPMPTRTRLISERAFDHCITELRNKAAYFKETGLIPTLDVDRFAIFKSDTLVTPEIHQDLKASFAKSMADQASNPDWHPWTQDMVWNLVHPSMYPFVYDRSRFIHDEVVGVADAVDKWSGKGQIPIQNLDSPTEDDWEVTIPEEFWSEKYQWLPSNLAFQQDGSVRFTSYINNLHPQRYSDIYTVIERLIDAAIPAWDRVLDWNWKSMGSFSRFYPPPRCDYDTPEESIWEKFNTETLKAVEQGGEIPCNERDIEDYLCETHSWGDVKAADEDTKKRWREEAIPQIKWTKIRDPLLPEPQIIRQYNTTYSDNLRERFREKGLQIIVKMASIELTPEKPTLPPGNWHVEGQLNEHIVATALYYIDEENIEPTALSFRQPTSWDQAELQGRVGQDMYHHYSRIFGVSLGTEGSPCLQNYGSIETKPRRLLVFPNTFQHCVSECTLRDKTKPGHRRFIALWLVNPEMRIISTANVPPQQLDWLSPERLDIIRGGSEGDLDLEALMTVEEARQHRLALMEERSRMQETSESNISAYHTFCEH